MASNGDRDQPDARGFSSRLPGWLWGLLLVITTALAYQPAWNGKPIWDDAAHLTYPELRSLSGLARIWIEPGSTQQYYPLTFSIFWLEHKLWGDSTLGYHLVNILLHAMAALLLLKILRTLKVPAAGLAAAIFALHPLQVETVAWISELKNTLSAVLYFGSALAWLRFDRTRNKAAYAGTLALFVLGLMAKTVIATLPAALLVVLWWRRGKLSWKQDALPLIPFFAAGIAAGLFTSWMERHFVNAEGPEFHLSFLDRFLIAGRAIWFYLGKLCWPSDLIFSYPRWKISPTTGWQYLFPGAVAALLAALWVLRQKARGPLAALLFFIVTLFPALGFLNVFPFKYSFVADHFQYLACCGPIVAAAIGVNNICRAFGGRRLFWERTFCAMLLATLGLLTWRQSRIYADIETLWRTTLERNPDCWLAQNDLGSVLYEKGQVDKAISLFRRALELYPDYAEAENNLGAALEKKGELDEAVTHFQKAVDIRPAFAEAENNLGMALDKRGQLNEAILHFQKAVATRPDIAKARYNLADALFRKGDVDEAILQFQEALEHQPGAYQTHYYLGLALLQRGRTDEAIIQFQEVVAARPDYAEAQNNLGYCLLQEGRKDEAVVHLRKALEIHPDYAQAHFNLGNALLKKGQVDEAIIQFQETLAIQPEVAAARNDLGRALLQKARVDEAILQFQKALAIQPGFVEARRNLADIAWRLATSPNPSLRNGAKAVELARQTDQIAGGSDPTMAAILAAADAEAGQFKEAVTAARRALQLATHQNNASMLAAVQAQLKCYEAGSPFRERAEHP